MVRDEIDSGGGAKEVIKTDGEGKKESTDESSYRTEKREGRNFFICNVCNHETKTAKTVRNYITMKHRPKPSEDSEDELEDAKKIKEDKLLDESQFGQWDSSKVYTSTQVPAEDILTRYDDVGNILMSELLIF